MATSIIKNGQDTGWIIINSTYGTRYRVRNGICFVQIKYNGNIPDSTDVGTIPSRYAPIDDIRFINYNPGSLDVSICLQVKTNGQCTILGAGNKWINIIGSYPV